jgi:hypothetical protein
VGRKTGENEGKRMSEKRLSLAEALTLNILRFYTHVQDLKAFHRLAARSFRDYFPGMSHCEHLVKAPNRSFPAIAVLLRLIAVFMKHPLFLNRIRSVKGVYSIDSAALSVCRNPCISAHRVAKGYALRGKTGGGCFFGFKARGVCPVEGSLPDILLATGSVPDCQVVPEITQTLEGLFVGNAGYLLREEVFWALYERCRHMMSAARKNTKRVMNGKQQRLFRGRSRIETAWGVLKERFQLVFHLARGITGLFRHYFYSIAGSLLCPAIDSRALRLEMPV